MMLPAIHKKIKLLELKTRKILRGSLLGDHATKLKGSGLEFDQIRPYEQGDDVRFIDWKSSAKANKLLVKQYLEDRNRDVVICVDVSSSALYSSSALSKQDVMNEIASVIAFIAEYAKDRVSLVLFSDTVELVVPKGSGSLHTHRIVNQLFEHAITPYTKSDINAALSHIIAHDFKESIVFIISDFIVQKDFSNAMKLIHKRCEVIAIQCRDVLEYKQFPSVGIVHMKDIETQEYITVNTHGLQNKPLDDFSSFFKKNNIEFLHLSLDEDYITKFIVFLKKRMMY